MKTSAKWKTRPISPTCEVMLADGKFCDLPTTYAYPAEGGGWMALCEKCAEKHLPHCAHINDLIQQGEKWQ